MVKKTKSVKKRTPAKTKELNQNEKLTAILSYLGILVLIPLFAVKKRNNFVKFHLQQGMNLFIIELILMIGTWIISLLYIPFYQFYGVIYLLQMVLWIVLLVIGILSLVALFKAIQGNLWKVPFFGNLKLYHIK